MDSDALHDAFPFRQLPNGHVGKVRNIQRRVVWDVLKPGNLRNTLEDGCSQWRANRVQRRRVGVRSWRRIRRPRHRTCRRHWLSDSEPVPWNGTVDR